MEKWDYSKTWFHGSPHQLTTIRKGSTITQDRHLAMVFSHKPTIVSLSDDGQIKHNGALPGFLYTISEDVQPDDVMPHPQSSMQPGLEWLTNRELRLEMIGVTQVVEDEYLTDTEIETLRKLMDTDTGSASSGS